MEHCYSVWGFCVLSLVPVGITERAYAELPDLCSIHRMDAAPAETLTSNRALNIHLLRIAFNLTSIFRHLLSSHMRNRRV